MVASPRGTRGQLLLVGAVALGIVILSLGTMLNSSLVTTSAGSGKSIDAISDSHTYAEVTKADSRTIILQVNHQHRNRTSTELTTHVRQNVSNYSNLLDQSLVDEGFATINVTFDEGASVEGTRVVQAREDVLASPSAGSPPITTWQVVPDSHRRDIGRFMLNVNVSATSTDHAYVNLTNATGEYVNVSINRTGSKLEIETERATGSGETTTCPGSGGRVLFDVATGRARQDSCSLTTLDGIEPPYNATVVHGEHATASYEIVVNDSLSDYSDDGTTTLPYPTCAGGADMNDPCAGPAVWRAIVNVSYDSHSIRTTQRHNVSIYP
jgi:hypothetical protein